MSIATATRRLPARPLRESAPLGGRVDRDHGIIYRVKVVGRSSPNTHGVPGASGTDYTLEALRGELGLLEGMNVNVDHPDRDRPKKDRSARDRFAWLEKCAIEAEGIFANLRFLDPQDPLAVKMLNAAELHPEAFALSHNALGQGEVRSGRYVVTHIPEVRSVDIVADGGTNRSLFEGAESVTTTLRHLIEASKASDKIKSLLLEMGDMGDAGGGSLMDADMGATPAASDWKGDLVAAIGKLVQSEDPEQHAMGLKIMKLLKPGGGETTVDDEDGDEGEGGQEDKPSLKKESRAARAPEKGEVVLTEARAVAMCKTAGVEATADVLEAIKGASFDQALAVINLAKRAAAPARGTSAPRSTAPVRALSEGAAPRDSKGWAEKLLS